MKKPNASKNSILVLLPLLLISSGGGDVRADETFRTPSQPANKIAKISDNMMSLQERIDLLRSLKPGDEFAFSTYVLEDDVVGRTLMAELASAARRGVKVRGIIDPSYSRLEDRYYYYLKNAGVEVKEFHPMNPGSKLSMIGTLMTKGLFFLNNRSHDKIWAAKIKQSDGTYVYKMIEGSRNLVDSHFGMDAFLAPHGELTLGQKLRAIVKALHDKRTYGDLSVQGAKGHSFLRARVEQLPVISKELKQKLTQALIDATDEKTILGQQYRDLDFIIQGKVAKEVFDYHDAVWASKHVQPPLIKHEAVLANESASMKAQVQALKDLKPGATENWVETARLQMGQAGLYDRADNFDPLRNAIPVEEIKFYHDTMIGNVPQGSEQGVLDGIRNARGGDIVKIAVDGASTDVVYSADLYHVLQQAKVGDEVEMAGKKVKLTQGMLDAFAKAVPGDELHMMSQYAVLTPEMEKEFKAAMDRGVKVKLLINGHMSLWDSQLPLRGYEKTYKALVDTGIEVLEYSGPAQVHAKALTVVNPKLKWKAAPELGYNGPYTLTGSSNLDPRSLTVRDPSRLKRALTLGASSLRNSEINFMIHDAQFTEYMRTELELAMSTSNVAAKGGVARIERTCPAAYRVLLQPLLIRNIL